MAYPNYVAPVPGPTATVPLAPNPLAPRRPKRPRRLSVRSRRLRKKYRFDPTRPPSGTFDPALDAQLRASQRGLADLTSDVGTQNLRSRQDFQLAQGDISRQLGEGLQDITRSRRNEAVDFGRQITGLNRQYGQLANRQRQATGVAGVSEGGAFAQALRKRAANQAFDQAPITTAHTRFGEESRISEQRLRGASARSTGRLALNFQRDFQDRNLVQLPRARREATEFGQDISAERFYQAKGTGYAPPSNQFRRHGLTYRVGGLKGPLGKRTYTLPSGQRLSRKRWVRYVARRGHG